MGSTASFSSMQRKTEKATTVNLNVAPVASAPAAVGTASGTKNSSVQSTPTPTTNASAVRKSAVPSTVTIPPNGPNSSTSSTLLKTQGSQSASKAPVQGGTITSTAGDATDSDHGVDGTVSTTTTVMKSDKARQAELSAPGLASAPDSGLTRPALNL